MYVVIRLQHISIMDIVIRLQEVYSVTIDNIYSVTGMRNIIKPEGTMRVVSGVIRACITP